MGASEGPHFLLCARPGSGELRPGLTAAEDLERWVVVELASLLATVLAGALGLGGCPLQAGTGLLCSDLDHLALVTFGGLPGAHAQLAGDDHPVALGQRV